MFWDVPNGQEIIPLHQSRELSSTLAYVQHPSWGSFHDERTLSSNMELIWAFENMKSFHYHTSQHQWGLTYSCGGFCHADIFYVNSLVGNFQTQGSEGLVTESPWSFPQYQCLSTRFLIQKSSRKDCIHSSEDFSISVLFHFPLISLYLPRHHFTFFIYIVIYNVSGCVG